MHAAMAPSRITAWRWKSLFRKKSHERYEDWCISGIFVVPVQRGDELVALALRLWAGGPANQTRRN